MNGGGLAWGLVPGLDPQQVLYRSSHPSRPRATTLHDASQAAHHPSLGPWFPDDNRIVTIFGVFLMRGGGEETIPMTSVWFI